MNKIWHSNNNDEIYDMTYTNRGIGDWKHFCLEDRKKTDPMDLEDDITFEYHFDYGTGKETRIEVPVLFQMFPEVDYSGDSLQFANESVLVLLQRAKDKSKDGNTHWYISSLEDRVILGRAFESDQDKEKVINSVKSKLWIFFKNIACNW